jgi:DNA polymerase-3 subunit epsilon
MSRLYAKLWRAVALTPLFDAKKTSVTVASSDSVIAIDLETTGLYAASGDRVIEIGAVAIEDGRVISEFHQLIHTSRRLSRSVSRVHGIDNKKLQGKPVPHEVFPRFRNFIGNHVLITHNASFDLRFLRQEFARLGVRLSNRFICTLKLAQSRLPSLPNYRLETVARHLLRDLPSDIPLHRALPDARLTARIWSELERNAGTKVGW